MILWEINCKNDGGNIQGGQKWITVIKCQFWSGKSLRKKNPSNRNAIYKEYET